MQMRPGALPGIADVSNELPNRDRLADRHGESAHPHVGVDAADRFAVNHVLDDCVDAEAAAVGGGHFRDNTACDGLDW